MKAEHPEVKEEEKGEAGRRVEESEGDKVDGDFGRFDPERQIAARGPGIQVTASLSPPQRRKDDKERDGVRSR